MDRWIGLESMTNYFIPFSLYLTDFKFAQFIISMQEEHIKKQHFVRSQSLWGVSCSRERLYWSVQSPKHTTPPINRHRHLQHIPAWILSPPPAWTMSMNSLGLIGHFVWDISKSEWSLLLPCCQCHYLLNCGSPQRLCKLTRVAPCSPSFMVHLH
jgi:hypothetical protein